jgi:hypothetical protein
MKRKIKPEPEEIDKLIKETGKINFDELLKKIKKASKELAKEKPEEIEKIKKQALKLSNAVRGEDSKTLFKMAITSAFDEAIKQMKEGNLKEAENAIEAGLKVILAIVVFIQAQASIAFALTLFEKFNEG